MIQREVLPNGVRIVTENITYVQSVALGIWVGVGARDEDELRPRHLPRHRTYAVQGDADTQCAADRRRD